jgi:hypothetical protein
LTAIVFFLQAFKVNEFEDIEPLNVLGSFAFINFIYKLYFISLSVSMISMLGYVIDFKNGNSMLVVGGCTLLILLVLIIFSKIEGKSKVYNQKFYLRLFACIAFLTYLAVNKGIIK